MPIDYSTGQWIPSTPAPQGDMNAMFAWIAQQEKERTTKWIKPAISMQGLQTASADSGSPFYGIDWDSVPEDIRQKASNFLGGVSGIKSKLYPQLLADVAKAMSAKGPITAQDTRNSVLDVRRQGMYAWDKQANDYNTEAAAEGTQGSGFYQKSMQDATAQRDAAINKGALATVKADSKTNYDYKQNLQNMAFNNMYSWVNTKKALRRGKEDWLAGLNQVRSQGQANNTQMASSALGMLGGMAGSWMGG